jgi:hypothetical protein
MATSLINTGIQFPDATIQTTAAKGINGPAFLAHRLTNTTLPSVTNTRLSFPTVVYDTASCYNNTASTVGGIPAWAFKPPVAGYYQFSSSCNYEQSVNCVRALLTVTKANATTGLQSFRLADQSVNTLRLCI